MFEGKKPGGWITGKEVMEEYGVRAFDIGEACFKGELKAFTEAGELLIEETKIPKIPKYLPVGVNPLEHIQHGIAVKWDWSECLVDSINEEAMTIAISKVVADGKHYSINVARSHAITLMENIWTPVKNPALCSWRPFPFCVQDYIEGLNNYSGYMLSHFDSPEFRDHAICGEPIATIDKDFYLYKERMETLLFKREEAEGYFVILSSEQSSIAVDEVQGETASLESEAKPDDLTFKNSAENFTIWSET
ncbi:MAG: hypothetical protein FWF95_08035, partial [Syntrophorhabdaceae bacterium]|nr:hypothetical protein [Syntrophorhabdaceae bacterium]